MSLIFTIVCLHDKCLSLIPGLTNFWSYASHTKWSTIPIHFITLEVLAVHWQTLSIWMIGYHKRKIKFCGRVRGLIIGLLGYEWITETGCWNVDSYYNKFPYFQWSNLITVIDNPGQNFEAQPDAFSEQPYCRSYFVTRLKAGNFKTL